MRYRVHHRTTCRYNDPVPEARHLLRMTPRTTERQTVADFTLATTPEASSRVERDDAFGNRLVWLVVDQPHREFTVAAGSLVDTTPGPVALPASPPWTEVRDRLAVDFHNRMLGTQRFRHPSPLVPCTARLAAWAASEFPPGRPLAEAALALCSRLHRDFRFDPHATTVSTPPEQVLDLGGGVCQDFAHLLLGGLRSLGLSARYVSGYIETQPPPGQPRLVGADASHAWVSVFIPDLGWLDLDPTNDCLAGEQHLTVAWGRDYSDVAPMRGVTLGGGEQTLEVAVDVAPVPAPAA